MSEIKTIQVTGESNYEIVVGRALLGEVAAAIGDKAKKVLVVHPVALTASAEQLREQLIASGFETILAGVPDTEEAKRVEVAAFCWQILGQADFTRTDAIVGFGGGSTTDLAGFVAGTWLRGVPFVQIPTTLLGMALARVREDRVVAIDANPDRGTLVERIQRSTRHTIRTVVQKAPSIGSFTDFSEYVSRDQTRLDVLASDADPMLSQAFDEFDYNIVADITSRYYSIILTDCGTGIVHSVMKPILQRADGLVIVSGGSIDEARLASETLTWLESNGYAELVANSVVALNTATQGTVLVKLDEIENHFKSRVRDVVRIPYDSHIAAGSVITWDKLSKLTRESASLLAALVVEGLPATK